VRHTAHDLVNIKASRLTTGRVFLSLKIIRRSLPDWGWGHGPPPAMAHVPRSCFCTARAADGQDGAIGRPQFLRRMAFLRFYEHLADHAGSLDQAVSLAALHGNL
jgi:hypothetical protein